MTDLPENDAEQQEEFLLEIKELFMEDNPFSTSVAVLSTEDTAKIVCAGDSEGGSGAMVAKTFLLLGQILLEGAPFALTPAIQELMDQADEYDKQLKFGVNINSDGQVKH